MTKESAGSQYHVSLAKELASVLEKALKVNEFSLTTNNQTMREILF